MIIFNFGLLNIDKFEKIEILDRSTFRIFFIFIWVICKDENQLHFWTYSKTTDKQDKKQIELFWVVAHNNEGKSTLI